MSTETLPVSSFYSTALNSRIKNYEGLSTRIAHTLGYPQVNIEAHQNQVFENIAIACEMFTKFAGYTREYMVFKSSLYEKGKGIKVDTLLSLTPEMYSQVQSIPENETTAYQIGNMILGEEKGLNRFTVGAAQPKWESNILIPRGFDDLLDNHRKVMDVFSFEEGSTSGINTLFTVEQTLAQQTYFSYAMGNYGFDLVSWYTLKSWLDTREKLLQTKRQFHFDPYNQRLFITPEPGETSFVGAVGAYVERPIRDIIKEPWIYQYALALTKINIARIRGKYSGTALFAGGSPNYSDLLAEGNAEKGALEARLYEGTPGLGDAEPPMFFVG